MKLIAKSPKGKQILKELGDNWKVVETRDKVLFSDRAGPWLFIQPNTCHRVLNQLRSRWIHKDGSVDLEISDNDT